MRKQVVVDRERGSKRKKKASPWGWLCNPQVLNAVLTGARVLFALVRLINDLVGGR